KIVCDFGPNVDWTLRELPLRGIEFLRMPSCLVISLGQRQTQPISQCSDSAPSPGKMQRIPWNRRELSERRHPTPPSARLGSLLSTPTDRKRREGASR